MSSTIGHNVVHNRTSRRPQQDVTSFAYIHIVLYVYTYRPLRIVVSTCLTPHKGKSGQTIVTSKANYSSLLNKAQMTFCKKLTQKHSEHSETLRMDPSKMSTTDGKPSISFGVFRSVRSVFASTFCKMLPKPCRVGLLYFVVRRSSSWSCVELQLLSRVTILS